MKSVAITFGAIVFLSACAKNNADPHYGEASGDTARALSDDGWSISKATSALDGDVILAEKSIHFRDRDTTFQIQASCTVAKQEPTFQIYSLVGDIKNPSQESEYQYTFSQFNAGMNAKAGISMEHLGIELNPNIPVGRAKFPSSDAIELRNAFRISTQYSNLLILNNGAAIRNALKDTIAAKSDLERQPQDNEVNIGAAIKTLFPIVLELSNGAGKFELNIPPSQPLIAALESCGGNNEVLKPSYELRLQRLDSDAVEAEAKRILGLKEYIARTIKNACRNDGAINRPTVIVSIKDELAKLPDAERAAIEPNISCSQMAPDELQYFNDNVESLYESYTQTTHISEIYRCNHEQFREYVSANGLASRGTSCSTD